MRVHRAEQCAQRSATGSCCRCSAHRRISSSLTPPPPWLESDAALFFSNLFISPLALSFSVACYPPVYPRRTVSDVSTQSAWAIRYEKHEKGAREREKDGVQLREREGKRRAAAVAAVVDLRRPPPRFSSFLSPLSSHSALSAAPLYAPPPPPTPFF